MTNPYIATADWFDGYRAACEGYDYRNKKKWPSDCPVWQVLAPADDFPHREWADRQAFEVTSNPYEPPVYVCHPYHLDAEALRDFLALERAGFRVNVSGYSECHPATLRVEIHAPKHLWTVDGAERLWNDSQVS